MADANATSSARAVELKDAGNAAYAAKRYDEAVQRYTQAIELDPRNHVLYSNRSGVLLDIRRYDEAVADAQACIERAPTWPKGYLRLAAAYTALKHFPEAKEALEKGFRIDANSDELKQMQVHIKQSERIAAAVDYTKRDLADRPTFQDCAEYACETITPASLPPISSLEEEAAKYRAIEIVSLPDRGRALVAARDISAFEEIFTESALLWGGPLARKGAIAPLIVEQSPVFALENPDGATEAALLQLEPFYSAHIALGGGERPLPPLSRAEVYVRAMTKNGILTCWNESLAPDDERRNLMFISRVVAMLNHDCDANAMISTSWEKSTCEIFVRVSSTRPIAKGEEITLGYVPRELRKEVRQGVLKRQYGFTCNCNRCKLPYDDCIVFKCPHCTTGRAFAMAKTCVDCNADISEATGSNGPLFAAFAAYRGRTDVSCAETVGLAPTPAGKAKSPLHPTAPQALADTMRLLWHCMPASWGLTSSTNADAQHVALSPQLARSTIAAVEEMLRAQEQRHPTNAGIWLVSLGHAYAANGDSKHAVTCYADAATRFKGEYGPKHPLTVQALVLAAKPPTTRLDIVQAEQRRSTLSSWIGAYGLTNEIITWWMSPVQPRIAPPKPSSATSNTAAKKAASTPEIHPDDRRSLRLLDLLTHRINNMTSYTPGRDMLAVLEPADEASAAAMQAKMEAQRGSTTIGRSDAATAGGNSDLSGMPSLEALEAAATAAPEQATDEN